MFHPVDNVLNLVDVASGTASSREISLDFNKVTYSPVVNMASLSCHP